MAVGITPDNYDPNARYDRGPNAAGGGRCSTQATLETGLGGTQTGLQSSGAMWSSDVRVGYNAAGVTRNNPGPNAAGRKRSLNST